MRTITFYVGITLVVALAITIWYITSATTIIFSDQGDMTQLATFDPFFHPTPTPR